MKRLGRSTFLALVALLMAVMPVMADVPPKPTCPPGTITVQEAEWVESTTSCPIRTFQASRSVCPSGYKESTRHPGYCYRGGWPDWPEDYVPKITETFGPITVQYKYFNSSACYRDLSYKYGVPGWARSAFDAQLPRFVWNETTPGHWNDPVCRLPIPGCTDEEALNFNPEAEVDDGSCEYPPVGEQCGRCSNITPFMYVEWFDRDGGCDGDYYNERVEYPNDERCGCVAILGCTDPKAENYNPEANEDDGSCEYYGVCDELSDPVYSEWTDWFLEDNIWIRHQYVEYFDSQDPERQCDLQIKTETMDAILGCRDPEATNFDPAADVDDGSCTYPPPKPVCPLQLLITYDPPEGWLSFCMVMTEGGVSVGRQPAICGWIADNQPCGGMVYDDGTEQGTWRCDRYGYERRPIVVLKCLWQRHLAGQRDPKSFAKCQALAP